MPLVEVLKPFNRHAHGELVHPPEVIEVSATRAEELKRLRLARDPVPVEKAAPVPANKMAPVPGNKAAPPLKRRGRPPGSKTRGR